MDNNFGTTLKDTGDGFFHVPCQGYSGGKAKAMEKLFSFALEKGKTNGFSVSQDFIRSFGTNVELAKEYIEYSK